MDNSIPFNKPCVVDKSQEYLIDVLHSGKLSGNGDYTKKCHSFSKINMALVKFF